MTPYALRFEIFKQAYNMLHDKYCMDYEIVRMEHENGNTVQYPEFPDLTKVLEQAEIINSFVSSK